MPELVRSGRTLCALAPNRDALVLAKGRARCSDAGMSAMASVLPDGPFVSTRAFRVTRAGLFAE